MTGMTLIEPVQRGAALMRDILAARPMPGEVMIWWLGQSGYAIKTTSTLFYIDLYLSEHLTAKYANSALPHIRMTESPLRGQEITGAAWVFSTHKHSDHLDPGTLPDLFAASPEARLVLPMANVDHAVALGLDRARLIPMRGDDSLRLGALTVHAIPAAHPDLAFVAPDGYPFLGFVFQADGLTLYHSGDTVIYPGLAERLKRFSVDIALLPINGTDERRLSFGTAPNMSAADAVDLAHYIGARLLIPHHYDMFTFNTADPADLVALAEAGGQPAVVLRCGERFTWRQPAARVAADANP